MTMPSSFELGKAISGNISSGFRDARETSAMEKALKLAQQTENPNDIDQILNQFVPRLSPERQEQAAQAFGRIKNQRVVQVQKQKTRQALQSEGYNPDLADLDPMLIKEFVKQKGNERLWKEAISDREQNGQVNPNNPPNQFNAAQNGENPKRSTESQWRIKPVYASHNVNPKFFRNDIGKYEAARLSESEKGFKRNEPYLKEIREQSEKQPFIQDSIRRAIIDVQSGNVSGALSALRAKLGKTFPSIIRAEEKDFTNAIKTVALDEFAATPGFRSQGEFFVLQSVLPELGNSKKAQELTLKSVQDASFMKSKEEEINLDVLRQSKEGEVPLNLRDIVKERMDDEWKKLYARRYAEDPEIWDKYINSPLGRDDLFFKDIEKIPVKSSSIDWNKFEKMVNLSGKKEAVIKSQVERRLSEGWHRANSVKFNESNPEHMKVFEELDEKFGGDREKVLKALGDRFRI